MSVRLSCALPPSAAIAEQAREAERLGYHRVWVFDSPALHGDLWIALAQVAAATERVGLGTGVAVAGLRHPMVTAAAAAAVADLAPGRLTLAFGTGHTARYAIGQRPVPVDDLVREVRQVRSLLAGEVVEIDGKHCQMRQLPGFGPARPVDVPVWLAASGPRATAAAIDLDVPGVLATSVPGRAWPEHALLRFGTVLRPGEDHTTPRVIDAAGPGWASIIHAAWEGTPTAVDDLPGGERWRADIEASRPERERHLDVHQGHMTTLTARDRDLATAAGPALLTVGWTGTPDQLRDKATQAAAAGVTEIVYVPTSPDVTSELTAYAEALGGFYGDGPSRASSSLMPGRGCRR
ncbi:5,10-methylenetetrahydromethanopterin reductase [Amycolatopsis xylanica]|uniref:5,10-methylenetetrahydromethanopterin reductase n=1 Tax=Amycolatopsis xylanica TaxID=589385 RepID=A0A1H3S7L3_9PSEU|nr:LLM class flavin-dependent oxidoreductase [Amycolatopsis xylanica]SDZ33894.1 5,10-methylenetetrahydromethanopterin reductase [Amycolatopsis xylanica]